MLGIGSLAVAQSSGYPQATGGQDKKPNAAQPSEGERQAAMKIASAADFNAALQAATDFVKKYPKSSLRPEIMRRLVAKAASTQDSAQQITMLESAITTFKEPADAEIIIPVLLEAYLKAEKIDEAFRIAATTIEKNPNDVVTLTEMAIVGFEQAKRNNPKFVQQSVQYATKATELIEGDKRPSGLDDTQWADYKTKWLAQLYQGQGVVSLMTRNLVEARARLDKSATLNPSDPVTFMMIGSLIQDEYSTLAQQVKSMLPGKAQDDALKKALEKMDLIIEFYARAVGLAEGNASFQKLHDELLVDLKSYYSYRHNNSTEGLQQLIDKYKKPQ
jgi:tetratricopeptide (TPR) repeat protein